jgi:PAS domain S-box-containing protein
MNDPPIRPAADDEYERQLREINQALLISSVRQHELTEQAQNAEQALRQSEEALARELAATQHLQQISTQMIQEGHPGPLYEQILDAAMAVMGSQMASIQTVDKSQGALRLLAFRGFSPEFGEILALSRPDTNTSCSVAKRMGDRMIVPDVETDNSIAGTPALEDLRKSGIRAVQSTPLFSRSGKLLGMISTYWRQPHQPLERELRLLDVLARQAADLMERLRTQAERIESERRFRTVIEQIIDYAIFTTDVEGRPTSWNEGVKRVLGFDEHEFLGQDVTQAMFTSEDLQSGVPQRKMAEAAATGRASSDQWMLRKDGTRFYAMGTTTAQRNEAGELVGFTKVKRDQTDRKRLEDELLAADRRKDEFLAMLSHELRNPLAPISMGLELMKTLRDDPDQSEKIRRLIERQTRQLITIVDDLLDVSRFTTGKLELRKRRVRLADVVQSAVEASQPLIAQARHELTVDIPEPPIDLDADPHRLAQVVSNLLNNAAKYTPDGGRIWLTTEAQGDEVVISVKDTGIGIATEMQEGIFDMFTQIKHPVNHGTAGLGIGLTLAKSLVQMHAGSIEVYSEGGGKGSEFRVRLPLLAEVPTEERQQVDIDTGEAKSKSRVLIVDDNKEAAEMLGMIIETLGNEVRTAYGGQQGIEIAAEFRPEVVFMDLRMPDLDGFEAARHIRKRPGGEAITLVALTGSGHEEDKRQTKEAGFHCHLVKPATRSHLQELFAKLCNGEMYPTDRSRL